MNSVLNPNNLLKYLNSEKHKPILQKQTNQIYIEMNVLDSTIPVFFDIRNEHTFLHIIAYLPYQLQRKTLHEAARMLHYLNRELDIPGFGMDEQKKLIFFRSGIPCPEKNLNEDLLSTYLSAIQLAVKTCLQAIETIVAGETTVNTLFHAPSTPS